MDSPDDLKEVQSESTTGSAADWDYEVVMPTNWKIRGRNPTMRLLSDDQIESLTSTGNPWPQNFFFATGSLAVGLLIQLRAGLVEAASRNTLWNSFFVMLILSLFFGCLAGRDYLRIRRAKRDIRNQSPSVQADAPTVRAKIKSER
jgi:hypothetical protein